MLGKVTRFLLPLLNHILVVRDNQPIDICHYVLILQVHCLHISEFLQCLCTESLF